jgi:hypothetical protein
MQWDIKVATTAGVFKVCDVDGKDCKMSHGDHGVPVEYGGDPIVHRTPSNDLHVRFKTVDGNIILAPSNRQSG